MADVGVFSRYKGFGDFQEAAKANNLKEALVGAQIQSAQAKALAAQQPNIKKLGEQGFLKAAQGLDVTPDEMAGMRYLDASTGGMQFDPVTGNAMQKPSLLDKIPLPAQANNQATPIPRGPIQPAQDSEFNQVMSGLKTAPGTGDFLSDVSAAPEQVNEFDAAFEQELAKAAGNPKLQQQLRADYSKKKYEMTDAESKNAGFADRMAESNPIIEAKTAAGLNPVSRVTSNIPLIGNIVAGSDYRSFNQAQRDFINAQLRRESGAVINPDEFANAAQQYFPQVGDDENVLAQKKANRDAVVNAMRRSAGPAYKAPDIKVPKASSLEEKGKAAFEAKKGFKTTPNGVQYRIVK